MDSSIATKKTRLLIIINMSDFKLISFENLSSLSYKDRTNWFQ